MELLLFFIALIAISLLAAVFGADSQDRIVASKEHAMALLGMSWDSSVRPRYTARDVEPANDAQPRVTRARPRRAMARQVMAGALYRAADWLEPDFTKVRAA